MQIEFSIVGKKTTAATLSGCSSVSLIVKYKGAVYDGVPIISGGEMDRLCCAITIALAIFSNSPFIIFDELFSSLNVEAKERCLMVIKKFLQGRTIIEVSYVPVPSVYYDNTITL